MDARRTAGGGLGPDEREASTVGRRHVLASVGASVGALLAGCTGEGPPPGLHAVSATVLYRPGVRGADYPADVPVRVTVENTSGQRRRGRLVVRLDRTDDGTGAGSEPRTWTQARDVQLQSVTTRAYVVVFEDVFAGEGSTDGLAASAHVESVGPTPTG
jgi:hypothetical protein